MSKTTKADLQSLYEAEIKAGTHKLTYNEWAAQRIMKEAMASPVKGKPVDKKPAKKGKTTVDKDIPSKKAAKKKPAPAPKKDVPMVGGHPVPDFALKGMEATASQPIPPDPARPDDSKVRDTGLTAKQEMFCREYLVDYNATQAAIRAGYSEKTARVIGQENLTKPAIQTFLIELQKPRLAKLEITSERILQEYASMAFVNLGDFMRRNEDGTLHTVDGMPSLDFTDATPEQIAGLSGFETIILPSMGEDEPNPIKIKVKLGDKKGSLDVLAKRAGLLKETVDVNVSGTVKIKDNKDLAMRVAFMLRQAAARDKKEPNKSETPPSG